jgi:hypothetical protein
MSLLVGQAVSDLHKFPVLGSRLSSGVVPV